MSDYTRGDPRQQGDPRARRRGVPEDPQHAAVPARRTSTTSIRPTDRVPHGAARGSRPLHPGALRRGRRSGSCRRTRVRLRHDLPGAERVRDGRSERVLRRRLEGSAVHVRRAVARAALGADGDVRHGRRPDAPDGADPVVHGRRAVAVPARARARSRCTSALFPTRGRARARSSTPSCSSAGTTLIGAPRTGARARSSRCGRTSRSAARCRRRSCCRRPTATSRFSRPTPRNCRCSSSSPRSSCGQRRPSEPRSDAAGRPSNAPAA